MKCPGCGAEVEGRFCGFCGTALEDRRCAGCGSTVPAAYRFCSQCGAAQGGEALGAGAAGASAGAGGPGGAADVAPPGPVDRERSRSGDPASEPAPHDPVMDRRGWYIIAAAVLAGLVFLALPYVFTGWADGGNGERMELSPQGSLPAPGPAPGVDLSTMTPREAADRLFNRVMNALGSGDQDEIDAFLPMAIDAYRLVPDLDADGHFHLSLLHQAGGDHGSGLETAERVLASQPDHLLALYAAAESARGMGDTARAEGHFRRVLEVFDAESSRDLPEYREHATLLPEIRRSAEEFLGR